MILSDMGEGGVQNGPKYRDVINEQPLLSCVSFALHGFAELELNIKSYVWNLDKCKRDVLLLRLYNKQ